MVLYRTDSGELIWPCIGKTLVRLLYDGVLYRTDLGEGFLVRKKTRVSDKVYVFWADEPL